MSSLVIDSLIVARVVSNYVTLSFSASSATATSWTYIMFKPAKALRDEVFCMDLSFTSSLDFHLILLSRTSWLTSYFRLFILGILFSMANVLSLY